MTLYELTGSYLTLLNMLEDPEVDEQAVTDTLEGVDGELEEKADNYAKIIAELKCRAEMLAKEEERLEMRRKALENNIKRLKSALQQAMVITGKTKFKTDLFSFAVQKNGVAPVILDVAPEKLPKAARVVTTKADLKVMAQLLKDFPSKYKRFAHFGERGESLRIR